MISASCDPAQAAPDVRRWPALVVLLTGTLLPPFDFFIVNVALPTIRADLRAPPDVAQLVVSLYAAAYAATLILGGRLGDLYGRKRAFVGGMLGFGLASALCGMAPNPETLILGRVLQGISAAIMAPQSLASIHALFPSAEKTRALGLYGATIGFASVAGQLLGGLLVAADPLGLGWRSVFLINLPVILFALPAALALLRENQAESSGRLDIPGAVLLATGLLAMLVPLIEGRQYHWPWWCIASLILGALALFAFWHYEKHREQANKTPLVFPSLLATHGLRRSLAAAFLFYTLAAFFLVFAVYEQAGLGHTPLAAGLAILPLGAGFLLGPLCGQHATRWLGARAASVGMALEVAGLLLTSALSLADAPIWLPLPLFIVGLGQGIALPVLVRLNVDHVAPRWAGLASGLVNATLQVGAAVSVALVGGLFFAIAPDGSSAASVRFGFVVATLTIASALLVAMKLIWKGPGQNSPTRVELRPSSYE